MRAKIGSWRALSGRSSTSGSPSSSPAYTYSSRAIRLEHRRRPGAASADVDVDRRGEFRAAVELAGVRLRIGSPVAGHGALGVVVVERPRREQPGGIIASTVERAAPRYASACHGASIRSNENASWNSSACAYSKRSGRRAVYASATSTTSRPGWSPS